MSLAKSVSDVESDLWGFVETGLGGRERGLPSFTEKNGRPDLLHVFMLSTLLGKTWTSPVQKKTFIKKDNREGGLGIRGTLNYVVFEGISRPNWEKGGATNLCRPRGSTSSTRGD